jgi:hypothetical protein
MKHIELFESFGAPNLPSPKGKKRTFTDAEITYYERFWNQVHFKYHSNKFFDSMWNKMKTKKELTHKQWEELEFLLQNGKSRYEAGILPKNY